MKVAVAGYGKLGGLELGYGSDLDLVFLHDSSGEIQQTKGDRPVDNTVFFLRLGQRHQRSAQHHLGFRERRLQLALLLLDAVPRLGLLAAGGFGLGARRGGVGEGVFHAGAGSGGVGQGGAFFITGGSVTVSDSTISGNSAQGGVGGTATCGPMSDRSYSTTRLKCASASLTTMSYAEMVLATVPAAPPTWKSQRATSCPPPISAIVPYLAG